MLVGSVGLIVAHGWWARSSERELDEQIRAYAAAGEAIYPADLNDRPVADADNAVIALRAAMGLMKDSAAEWRTFGQVDLRLPMSRAVGRMVSTVLEGNRAALRRLDEAAEKPGADWGMRFESPLLMARPEGLPGALHATVLLRAAALYAHDQGDELEALRRVRQMLAVARIVDRQGLEEAHAAALAIAAMAARAACEIAPDLKLRSPSLVSARRLSEEFLNERWMMEGQARSLRASRAIMWDTAKAVAGGRSELLMDGDRQPGAAPGRLGCYAAKPLMMTDALWMVRYASAMTDAARRAADWPAFMRTAPPDPIGLALQPRGHFLAIALLPDFRQSIGAQYRAMTECRIAAIALAAGTYAGERAGAWPAGAEQLVGAYLPYVPFDPMAAGGRPLRLVSAAEGAVVYSVGSDGVDDGGSAVTPAGWNGRAAGDWERRDFVVTLKRRPPTTMPAGGHS
ncbi:MAG: hypothetical protein JWN40_5555 [Phycisphaerales bacterium]|nr:hypothetical protein [Phycisphaerales bacterium]